MNTEEAKLVSKETPYKSLKAPFSKPLCKTPPTHQKGMAKWQERLSNVQYFPSEQLRGVDTFPRAPMNQQHLELRIRRVFEQVYI